MCKLEQPDPGPVVGLSRAAVREEVPEGVQQRPAREGGGRPLLMTDCTVDAGKQRRTVDSLFIDLPNLLCDLVQASEYVPAALLCLLQQPTTGLGRWLCT